MYKRPKGAGEKEAQRDAEAKKMKDGNARLLDFIACLERGVRGTHSQKEVVRILGTISENAPDRACGASKSC